MKKTRTGLVGGGFVGRIHAEALRRLGFVEVVALAEANQKLAEEIAAELSIPRAYGDYRDLIHDKDIDTVHILTPNTLHYPIAKMCIEKGKHVLCEKPLAMDSKESADLVRMAEKSGLVNVICHNLRYYPLVKQAREMVQANHLGSIRLIHGGYLQDWLLYDADYNWRVESRLGGKSRAVADIGSHWLDMIEHVTGLKVVSVFSDLTTLMPIRKKPKVELATFGEHNLRPEDYEEVSIDTEDHGTVLLRFTGGVKGVLLVCQMSAGRKNRIHFEINGSERSIAWNGEEANELWIGERGKMNGMLMKNPALMPREVAKYAGAPGGLAEGYLDTFKNLFGDVYAYIAEGSKPGRKQPDFPNFKVGHERLLIVDAVLKSQASGKWVNVEES
jgi:predicted dehydrogenase